MKKFTWILTLVLCLSLLAGCMGTPVVYNNCTCPTGSVPSGSTGHPHPPAAAGG